MRRAIGSTSRAGLGDSNVYRLISLGTVLDFKFNDVPFFEGFKAVHLDSGEMREEIFAATVADRHYVMENGRVVDMIPNAQLEANMGKLHEYLGV